MQVFIVINADQDADPSSRVVAVFLTQAKADSLATRINDCLTSWHLEEPVQVVIKTVGVIEK